MSPDGHILRRLNDRVQAWRVLIDETFETASSIIAYGRRDVDSVVLKLVKHRGDEWDAGVVLSAFGGRGMVRVHEFTGGAMLLERLRPGHSLADLSNHGRDVEATGALASVIGAMQPNAEVRRFPTVEEWGSAFARHAASAGGSLSPHLVSQAEQVYARLASTQTRRRLLHGDLQHFNVLFDKDRGWVGIDPKGVVGELEFEVGAALRNPCDRPDIFADPAVIGCRVARYTARLSLDADRVLGWAFAQAVLSAIWAIEDGITDPATHSSVQLALAVAPMLNGVLD